MNLVVGGLICVDERELFSNFSQIVLRSLTSIDDSM